MDSKPLDYAKLGIISPDRSILASLAIRAAIVLIAAAAFKQLGAYSMRYVPFYRFIAGDYGLILGGIVAIAGITMAAISIRAKRSVVAIIIIVIASVWGAPPILYR